MCVPLRAMPWVGRPVLIEFLSGPVAGTVSRVDEAGRQVEVVTENGDPVTFTLNRATATFTADGGQTAARLRFPPQSDRCADHV